MQTIIFDLSQYPISVMKTITLPTNLDIRFRGSMRLLAVVLTFITVLSACSSANRNLFPADPEERDIEVQVVSHGWHVGIVLPVNEHLMDVMPSSLHVINEESFAEFGWGDRDYYMDDSPGIWTTIKGGLLPSSSTLHVAGFSNEPEEQFPQLERVTIRLTEEGYRALLLRAEDYFSRDSQGEVIELGDGLYANSRFYESPKWYYVPKTSNKWVAQLLKEAGLPVNTFTAVRASNVIRQAARSGEHHVP